MSQCQLCEGPIVQCQRCKRWHCDDETCSEMPIDCAQWAQDEEES